MKTSPAIIRYLALLGVLALTMVPVRDAWSAAGDTLRFLTWSEYIDPEIVAEFERQTGATIEFHYYETDDFRDQILAAAGGRGYDLVMLPGSKAAAYQRRGWIAPLDRTRLPNAEHISARWRDAFPGVARVAVPYFWGTLGIAYRRDLVPGGFTRWMDLLQPDEALRGRIIMIRAHRDVIGMALKSLGYSANSTDANALRDVEKLLEGQKPFVKDYTYISLEEDSALVKGDVWATMAYSGDALMLAEHHPEIAYVVPEEGSNLWVDYLSVTADSSNQALAHRFINFLNRPDIAARNAEFVFYATPNMAAEALLSEDLRNNPVAYPDAAVLARSETYEDLPPRAQKRANALFARLLR